MVHKLNIPRERHIPIEYNPVQQQTIHPSVQPGHSLYTDQALLPSKAIAIETRSSHKYSKIFSYLLCLCAAPDGGCIYLWVSGEASKCIHAWMHSAEHHLHLAGRTDWQIGGPNWQPKAVESVTSSSVILSSLCGGSVPLNMFSFATFDLQHLEKVCPNIKKTYRYMGQWSSCNKISLSCILLGTLVVGQDDEKWYGNY